ncbi:hypothetical protein HPB49_020228 [Dermacentor silvarum]|uniref:Uncharacterized protein n=1 Tax=Dermacentor silvarum TaxID=543639 RepID=A0ACB8DKU3_DERSI|nr:hypothetical protein HPB49_020228 [Dermacentor silvarum]
MSGEPPAARVRHPRFGPVGSCTDAGIPASQQGLAAFVLTRITFALPFQATRKTEIENIDKLIRTAHKAALKFLNCTSADRLTSIGINNTYEELAAATLIAQRERLNTTHQGRKLLQRLGYPLTPQYCGDDTLIVPMHLRARIIVEPVPMSMHPL